MNDVVVARQSHVAVNGDCHVVNFVDDSVVASLDSGTLVMNAMAVVAVVHRSFLDDYYYRPNSSGGGVSLMEVDVT